MTKILKLINDCAADCPYAAYENGGYICQRTLQRGPWANSDMARLRVIPTEWPAPGKPSTPIPDWCPLADYVPPGVKGRALPPMPWAADPVPDDAIPLAQARTAGVAESVTVPTDLVRRLLNRLEYPGPSWLEHRAGLAAELRAAAGVKPNYFDARDAAARALLAEAAAPSLPDGVAPSEKVQMPDKARAGIEVLHRVVESLLTTSRYVDEEGEATQALADLSDCIADPPFTLAAGVPGTDGGRDAG
jgi:hypothetical protein